MLDNAEFYLDDAVQFFRQGKKDGILSIGYADGLVDSIKQMLEIKVNQVSIFGFDTPFMTIDTKQIIY